MSRLSILKSFEPTLAISYNASARAFHVLYNPVSIKTVSCHSAEMIAKDVKSLQNHELLYLYPSDIGCQ